VNWRLRISFGGVVRLCAVAAIAAMAFAGKPASPAAATTTGLHVTLLSSSHWGPDSVGYLHAVGEVINDGTEHAVFIQIELDYFNVSNTLLGTATTFTEADILAPGEHSSYSYPFTPPAGYDHFSAKLVDFRLSASPPNHNFSTQVTNWFTDSIGYQHVVGIVTNNNTTQATYVEPIFTFYDCAGALVDGDFTFTNGSSTIAAGQSATYELVRSQGAPAAASVSVFTQSVDNPSPFAIPPVTRVSSVPPTNVAASPRSGSAHVTWTAPSCNGGTPVSGYKVTPYVGAIPQAPTVVGPSAISADVAGLTNGTSYTFTVRQTNATADSAESSPSNAVTPAAVPGAPTGVTATPGNASASVSWTAPTSNGGSPINGYVVRAAPGSATASAGPSSNSAVVSGLSNGTSYTFTVVAQNAAGSSPASAPSNAIVPGMAPDAPRQVTAIAGDQEATVTWWPPPSPGSSAIAHYTIAASPGTASVTVSPITPAATVTGLTNGTSYTFTVTASNTFGTGAASATSNSVTPTAVSVSARVALLPVMSSGAYGGYVTVAYLENTTNSTAHVRVQYYDQDGNAVGKGNAVAALPYRATWTLRQDNADALAAGQAGSAVIFSDQPLAAFVNEFAPNSGDATSYSAIKSPAGTGPTLYAPAIANSAYGGYTTGIGLLNAGTAATDVRITYRDGSGAIVKEQTLIGVAAGAYRGLYSGDSILGLPAAFAGTATIESTSTPAQPLAAVVNEVGPGGQFSSYDAVPSGQQTLQAPTALSNAFGGFNTGIGIQNTTSTQGAVAISYYDSTGTLARTSTFQIAANGYLGVYQGTDVAAGAYTARINSSTSGVLLAAIVNEVAPLNGNARQSTSYNAVAGGAAAQDLPLVESSGPDGWSTGLGIMNTGTGATTVTVTYFDAATGSPLGTSQSQLLAPNAFWGLYQPTGGLPAGSHASAEVTTSGGTVAVIGNESNATSFMSYNAQ
jgi:hypothetical protein